jgi:hypothetical protein
MIATVIKRVLGLWILALLPVLSYAEVPSGHYENHFDRQPYGVWDLSGTYHNGMYLGGLIDDGLFNFTLVQDDKGKISGQGTVAGSQDGYDANASFMASGSIKSKGNATTAVLKTILAGTVTQSSTEYNATGKVKLTGQIDKPTSLLRGSIRGKVCAIGKGCKSVGETAELSLPLETYGDWDLFMDITNVDGKKLTGTAIAVVKNGNGANREVPFALKGQYNGSTDLAKLGLKGSGGSFTIQARATGGTLTIQTMKGKLLGQAVKYP